MTETSLDRPQNRRAWPSPNDDTGSTKPRPMARDLSPNVALRFTRGRVAHQPANTRFRRRVGLQPLGRGLGLYAEESMPKAVVAGFQAREGRGQPRWVTGQRGSARVGGVLPRPRQREQERLRDPRRDDHRQQGQRRKPHEPRQNQGQADQRDEGGRTAERGRHVAERAGEPQQANVAVGDVRHFMGQHPAKLSKVEGAHHAGRQHDGSVVRFADRERLRLAVERDEQRRRPRQAGAVRQPVQHVDHVGRLDAPKRPRVHGAQDPRVRDLGRHEPQSPHAQQGDGEARCSREQQPHTRSEGRQSGEEKHSLQSFGHRQTQHAHDGFTVNRTVRCASHKRGFAGPPYCACGATRYSLLVAASGDSAAEITQFGPYRVHAELGRGGMCLVYRARHDERDYDVALKLLREDRRKDEQMVEMFITEADLAMLLDHPNLVRTFDAGEVDGRHYIAMELIEGGTLDRLLRRGRETAAPLPLDFALFAVSEVLEGLYALHTATGKTGRPLGLIHRDVTPQNIFLSFDGRVILGDFGVALIQAYGDGDPRSVLGKLGYLAPEMVLMEDVDHRADIFAAGVVAWELVTGERLFFGGAEAEVLERIADAKVARPSRYRPSLPSGLDDAILKALARRPKDRYDSAEAMLTALEPFWSKMLANPYGLAAYLAAMFPQEAARYRQTHKPLTPKPKSSSGL